MARTGGAAGLAIQRRVSVLPSPYKQQGRRLQLVVFEAQYPARRWAVAALVYASDRTGTMRPARLGVRMDSLLLSCRTLSFPIACRFIPAHRLSHRALHRIRHGSTLLSELIIGNHR